MGLANHRPLYYAILPAVVGAALVAGYFSGVEWLQTLVAPRTQREYGLVENLQNVTLLAIVWVSWRAARDVRGLARLGWLGLAAFAVLVFFEEIDWGNHYYRSWIGKPRVTTTEGHFNLHNQGNAQTPIKKVVDLGMLLFFFLLPLLSSKLPAALARWIPHRWTIATALIGVALSRTAHVLEDTAVHNGSLRSNISEFREVFVYWMSLLYLIELSCVRRPATPDE